MQNSLIYVDAQQHYAYFPRSITQQHYTQLYCSITHAHTATSHLVTQKPRTLNQAAAD